MTHAVFLFPPSPGPLYGSLMRAWQCFFTSTERLSDLHSTISQSLVAEEGDQVKTWQKETFPKKIFCGFRESYDNNTSFSRAQKPWSKKLMKVSAQWSFRLCVCVWVCTYRYHITIPYSHGSHFPVTSRLGWVTQMPYRPTKSYLLALHRFLF